MEHIVTVLIPVIAVAVIVFLAKRIAAHNFRCRHCDRDFFVKWTKVLVTVYSDDEYKLECPYCKTKDWCVMQR